MLKINTNLLNKTVYLKIVELQRNQANYSIAEK